MEIINILYDRGVSDIGLKRECAHIESTYMRSGWRRGSSIDLVSLPSATDRREWRLRDNDRMHGRCR